MKSVATKDSLHLWELDDGGTCFWIVAYNAYEAVKIVHELMFNNQTPQGDEGFTIERMSSLRASSIVYVNVDGTQCSLWEQYMDTTEPKYLAGTELP